MPAQNRVDENAKDDVYRATLAQATREKMKDTVQRQMEEKMAKERKR